ncbi:hypothetical protein PENTCL1PPCAC_17594 [Pristionchus entomophagus]|uniref:Uncharacterized protein n=1 Tax=Pristionchus entomophagus TaxID=358040 RepID=A0AAV5TMA4_9BILA|nr:hypothetical protein PENTCL1PPCAC_17594 [Pristionchus entomophagus]
MRGESTKDLLVEIYKFNQENRLDFYAYVKVILEQSQCAIISKPYWPVVDGNPGAEVFTIFPPLGCTVCNKFKEDDIKKFTHHVIRCLESKDVMKGTADIKQYEQYGVIPKSVKGVIDEARTQRDHNAVCIAPVLDHPDIKGLADLQRKERERLTEEMANSEHEVNGPIGPVLKLAKGAEMPLDKMVWIQTPLTSELATLLLAGMQPIRHSPRGIHLPILFRDTGLTKVIHLHVERFEELAAVRMAEQNWELMKVELQQVGLHNEVEMSGPVIPCIPDVMTGDPKDAFNKFIGKSLNIKRPKDLLTEKKITQSLADDVMSERRRVEKEKNQEQSIIDRRHLAEIAKEKAAERGSNSMEGKKRANGDTMLTRNSGHSSDEGPGCSKYT